MELKIPYGEAKIGLAIDKERVSGILEANEVAVGDETETIRCAIETPVNSRSFGDFLADAKDLLIIVNLGSGRFQQI